MKKKIIIFTNDYKNIINLRYDLIKFLKNYYNIETLIIDKKKNNLENIYSLNHNYKSFNILKDFKLLVEIFSFLKKKITRFSNKFYFKTLNIWNIHILLIRNKIYDSCYWPRINLFKQLYQIFLSIYNENSFLF